MTPRRRRNRINCPRVRETSVRDNGVWGWALIRVARHQGRNPKYDTRAARVEDCRETRGGCPGDIGCGSRVIIK